MRFQPCLCPRFARLCLLLWVAGCGSLASAQEQGREFWPEVDIWKQLDEKQKLLLQLSRANGRDYPFREDAAALYYDYRFSPSFAMRGGYMYLLAGPTPDERETEHRAILDATFRTPFAGNWLLSDRNRFEARWRPTGLTARYRNRVRFETTLPVGRRDPVSGTRGTVLVPYGTVELIYDTRYHAISRMEYVLGIEVPLNRTWMVDTYFTYQHNYYATPTHINALGVVLNVFL